VGGYEEQSTQQQQFITLEQPQPKTLSSLSRHPESIDHLEPPTLTMSALKSIAIISLLALSGLTAASPSLFERRAVCATCKPIAGQNLCDPSTSCITTGSNSYCACRAGYKAANNVPLDPNIQFRLTGADFENRVFVPTGVACDTLCDNPYAGPGPEGLCSEVLLTTCLP